MNAPLVIPQFIPVPNGKGNRERQRTEAAKFRAILLDLMATNGPMGVKRLSELSGVKVSTIRDHLDKMLAHGLIESEKIFGRIETGGGGVTCVYRAAGGDIPSKQRTVSKWKPNAKPDPYALPTAFFRGQA